MNRKHVIALLFGLVFLLGAVVNVAAQSKSGEHAAPSSSAAPNGTTSMILTYQGRLTDKNGAPINSTVNVVFKLYDVWNSLLWTSSTRSITPIDGLFTVYLGDSNDAAPLHYPYFPASIGVTVGSDSEMTPRQSLNSVIGYSANDSAITGVSQTGSGVYGASTAGAGVIATNGSATRAALIAYNQDTSAFALSLQGGGIQVLTAGVDTTTPIFMHKVVVGGSGNNVCAPYGSINYATIIDNPLTNGDPNAILIVTPNFRKSDNSQSSGSGPAKDIPAVFYSVSGGCGNIGKWVIYNLNAVAMNDNTFYNVMVIKP